MVERSPIGSGQAGRYQPQLAQKTSWFKGSSLVRCGVWFESKKREIEGTAYAGGFIARGRGRIWFRTSDLHGGKKPNHIKTSEVGCTRGRKRLSNKSTTAEVSTPAKRSRSSRDATVRNLPAILIQLVHSKDEIREQETDHTRGD